MLGRPRIPRGGAETILVAEDNAALKALAEEVLSSQGYKVILASNGAEAVRLFQDIQIRSHWCFWTW
jgi:two-component system, cell cycle sensor histidine kinase and response regulator CckA